MARAVAIAAAAHILWLLAVSVGVGAAASQLDPPVGLHGCDTTCGDVVVPYPFGIGPANCSLPGYHLTCDTSGGQPPRLLLGDLQVIGNYYAGSLLTLNIDTDSIQAFLRSLRDDGPYSLSSRNELTMTGCNVRSTIANGNITVSGCSSFCAIFNGSLDIGRDIQGCSGSDTGCCHAPIVDIEDNILASTAAYDLQLKWFGWNPTIDQKWPPRLYIAYRGWFDEQADSLGLLRTDQSPSLDATQAPILINWEIVGHDAPPADTHNRTCIGGRRGGYVCYCEDGFIGNPYLNNDGCTDYDECKGEEGRLCFGECVNTVGSYSCHCPRGTHGDPYLPGGCINSTKGTGGRSCNRTCGHVNVQYPFGINGIGPAGCYLPGFNLTCDTKHQPPRLLLGKHGSLRIDSINLEEHTVRVFWTGPFINGTTQSDEFVFKSVFPRPEETPYWLSTRNQLTLVGCNARTTMVGNNYPDIFSGCASFCQGTNTYTSTHRAPRTTKDTGCYGMGCCQSHISMSMDGSLPTNLYFERTEQSSNPPPVYVFITQEGWFDHQQGFPFDSRSLVVQEVPIILQWEVLPLQGLPKPDTKSYPNCSWEVTQKLCRSKHSYCKPGKRGYICHCEETYRGNPYSLHNDGCQGGPHKILSTGAYVAIGISIGAGLILLVLAAFFISNKFKRRRVQMMKRKFFEQNRGRLLQQLVSQRADIAEKMIISLDEIEKATYNFDKSRELGAGGNGTVYKGILSDQHVVAIKRPNKVVQRQIVEFINEVAILSQINHRNIVKLYGCCLETEVPLLVYEFIPNGTLCDHLHVEGNLSLTWDDRLRIATETAGCLSYLHSTASIPIIHRDVKSVNILLDASLTSKVADFGASRYVPMDGSGVTTVVQGTRGYMDPMCFQTGRLTEKSDVYSFGVILVELLTRKKPFSYQFIQGEGLAVGFATLFAQGNLIEMLDPQVIEEADDKVEKVAELAVKCIRLTPEDRPTMKQVESALGNLQSDKQLVLGEEVNGVATNYPATADGSDESTRRYSMEEELLLSSQYPR